MERIYKRYLLTIFLGKALSIDTVYMWGTFGNNLTEKLIEQKKKQYGTKRYSSERVEKLKKKLGYQYVACDCCGLMKWFLFTDGGKNAKPVYEERYDLTASGFYGEAKVKGKIETLPERTGLGLWRNGHMGIYIGNGNCIECTLSSRGDGVVVSKVADCGFTHWFEFVEIDYSDEQIQKVDEVSCKDDSHASEVKEEKKVVSASPILNQFKVAVPLPGKKVGLAGVKASLKAIFGIK